MMIDLRKSQIFKRQMPQTRDGAIGRKLALTHLFK